MKNGHIRLGNPDDLRDYLLVEPKQYQKTPANQMAVKLGGGAGSYDDLAAWQGWLQENWQAGVGKREAADEGFLYAELETRFKGQLCLPLYHDLEWTGYTAGGYTKTENWMPGVSTIREFTSSEKIAFQFTHGNTGNNYINNIYVLAIPAIETSAVGVSVYTDTGGNPDAGTLVGTFASRSSSYAGLQADWRKLDYATSGFAAGSYWIVLTFNANVSLPLYDHGSAAATRKLYTGGAWANSEYSFGFHIQNLSASDKLGAIQVINYANVPHFLRTATTNPGLYKYASSTVSRATALSATGTCMAAFGEKMYIGYGGSRGIDSWNGTAISNQAGKYANEFATWNGYLWRAYENDVWYSTDGTTWTGPIQIGPDGYTVTGMAGLDRDMYVATDEALYKVAEFDQVFGICKWNNVSTNNGAKMIHHQGALYIPTYSDLLRFGGSEFMSITPHKEEGLPEYKQGKILALASHNYWLLAVVASLTGQSSQSYPLVLAYNDQGWHYIGKLLEGETSALHKVGLSWDVVNNVLWVAAEQALYKFLLPVDHQNPYKDQGGVATVLAVAPTVQSGHTEGNSTSSETTTTVTKPATSPSGDLVFVAMGSDKNGQNFSYDSAFTEIHEQSYQSTGTALVVYKTSSGSESNYRFTMSSAERQAWICWSVAGPASVHATTTANNGSGSTATFPAITTSIDDCLLIRVCVADADVTPFGSMSGSGWSLVESIWYSSAQAVGVWKKTLATAGTEAAGTATLNVSDQWWATTFAIAPSEGVSRSMKFCPYGYFETPWFYGGLKELQKDCESVYISGENISSSRPIEVYWKDDDSTDWELLGTVTSNRQELRWSDYDTRPNTRQIKLALIMYSDDYTRTPRVEVIRLKYMTMVSDRFRWQLPVMVSDEQQMLDGDLNFHTATQMRAHIDSMVNSVPPVIFEDLDGTQYEVKVLSAVENVQEYRYEDGQQKIVWVYSLSLEQVTGDTYGG